jgi:hypothetical protein
MKVVYDPSVLQPTATASSSSSTTTGPENAIDGNTTTFWESALGDSDTVGPWVQVDLTRLLKVYNIQITFDSIEVPSQLVVLSSDAPTDANYGTYPTSSSSAFDLIATIVPINNGTNTISLANGKVARYWRFQSTTQTQIRIKDITIYATSNIGNTTSRLNINGTMFYDGGNDLIKSNIFEQVSKGINSVQFTINNKDGKYLSANYPVGSSCRAWIDGVQKLLGTLIEFIPLFSPVQGLIIEGTIHDDGDYLVNNTLFQAWAGAAIADNTAKNDIIAQGANSILGMTTNSVGAQVINSGGVQQTTGGINTPFYQKADHIDAWKMLQNLQKRAVSGAWVLQNTGFDLGSVTTATLGLGLSSSDGFWTSYQTAAKFGGSVRDNSQGNPAPSGVLDTTAVVAGGVLSASLSNYGTGLSSTNTYDGNIKNDTYYLFAEIFQPCLVNVADLNQTMSLSFFITENPGNVSNDIWDIIIETIPSPGVTRRYHYLMNYTSTHPGAVGSSTPANTATDYYNTTLTSGSPINRNFYSDYNSAFSAFPGNAAGSDVIIAVRIRLLPFQNLASQNSNKVYVDNFSITPIAGVNIPPVQYDFNVGVGANGKSTLNWFPQPRAGVDLNYRHLDSSNNLKWFKAFPDSDLNNISDFKFTKGDLYRTKTDVTVHGNQIKTVNDGAQYDASLATSDIQYLAGQNPPHGSPFLTASIKSSVDQAQYGRRVTQLKVNDSNFSDLSRTAIAQYNSMRTAEQRALVTAKGNANLTPGYVVYVQSDFSDIQGYYYIVTAEHRWDETGYETVLTLQDDRFRFANDFAKVQADIANVFTTAPALKSKTYIKKGANLAGATSPGNSNKSNTSHLWQYSQDQDVIRLPYNFLPELSTITNVRVTCTRMLGLEGIGTEVVPGDWEPVGDTATGWDQTITINNHPAGSTNKEVQITVQQLVAQRFVMPVVSSGRLLFRLNGRIPTTASLTGTYLQAAVVQDSASSGTPNPFLTGQAFSASGTPAVFGWLGSVIVNGLFGTPPSAAPVLGGWKNIPFANIHQAGTDAEDDTVANDKDLFIEIENAAQGGFVPNQIYWLVLKASSGGQNVWLQYQNNTGQYLNYFAAKQTNGVGTAWASLGGAFGDNALFGNFYTQEALTSAGAAGEGAGNKATLWDPYTGNAFPFTAPKSAANGSLLGTDQQYSVSEFPSYIVARKNGFGQVDVSFVVSVGGAKGPPGATPEVPPDANGYKSYGRCDYACTVTYFE